MNYLAILSNDEVPIYPRWSILKDHHIPVPHVCTFLLAPYYCRHVSLGRSSDCRCYCGVCDP